MKAMIFRKSAERAGKSVAAFFAGVACMMGIGMFSVSCDMLDDSAVEVNENEVDGRAVPCVVSFNASFDEIYTKDEMTAGTKASAESCLRLYWSKGDYIWAYTKVDGAWTYAGKLEVAEEGYTAKVSGELTIVPDGDLYLVHGTYLQEAPEISADGSITIDMSDQGGSTMIVAYGKIEKVSVDGGTATVDKKVLFTFANSFIRINCYDLPWADENGQILAMTFLKGMMSHTNTKIGISFGDEVTVTGSNEGDITFSCDSINHGITDGKAVVWVSVPPIDIDYDRSIYVDYQYISNNGVYESKAEKVAKWEHGSGELINAMAKFEEIDIVSDICILPEEIDGKLTPGNTVQVVLSYKGDYLYNDSLVWTSSDPTVGTIDQNGLFTALKAGETKITLTGKYTYITGFTCTANITVEEE